jgi:hypothetical protein
MTDPGEKFRFEATRLLSRTEMKRLDRAAGRSIVDYCLADTKC